MFARRRCLWNIFALSDWLTCKKVCWVATVRRVALRTVSVFGENVTYTTSVPRFTSDKSRGSMLLPLSLFSSRHFVPRSESGRNKQRSTLFKIMAIRNDRSHSMMKPTATSTTYAESCCFWRLTVDRELKFVIRKNNQIYAWDGKYKERCWLKKCRISTCASERDQSLNESGWKIKY